MTLLRRNLLILLRFYYHSRFAYSFLLELFLAEPLSFRQGTATTLAKREITIVFYLGDRYSPRVTIHGLEVCNLDYPDDRGTTITCLIVAP
jgi:hypothetical protein